MGKLHDAAKIGDVTQIRRVLKGSWLGKTVPVDQFDGDGRTALQ